MNDELKPKNTSSADPQAATKPTTRKRSSWVPVFVLCGVFLVGFVPMWLKSHRLNYELFRSQRQTRVDAIQIAFANATLDARRGDYEPARQQMTKFFSLVTAEMDRGVGSALPTALADELKPVLAQRDNLITLLARGDPASAERLATAYAGFEKVLTNTNAVTP